MFLGSSFGTFGYSRRLHVIPVLHCLGLVAGGLGLVWAAFSVYFQVIMDSEFLVALLVHSWISRVELGFFEYHS